MRRTLRMLLGVSVGLLLVAPLCLRPVDAASEEAAKEQPVPARKVLVVAKVQEEAKRRWLEEAARTELKERGVETILGSDVMTEADFASEESIRAKVESLGVDGVIGYVPLKIDETVHQSSASLSIGIGGYGGGGFGGFVGGSVPIGGSTTVVRTVHVRTRYWAKPFTGPVWEKIYSEKLKEDTSDLMEDLAESTVKDLKKKKFIPAK